jgi:hypothetical protein
MVSGWEGKDLASRALRPFTIGRSGRTVSTRGGARAPGRSPADRERIAERTGSAGRPSKPARRPCHVSPAGHQRHAERVEQPSNLVAFGICPRGLKHPESECSGSLPLFSRCAYVWYRDGSIFRAGTRNGWPVGGAHENSAGPSLGSVRRAACRLQRMGRRLVCQIITIPRRNSGRSHAQVGYRNHHPLEFRSSGGGCDNVAWLELPDALLHRAFGRWAVHGDFHAPGLCSEHRSRSTRGRAAGRIGSEIRTRPGICRTSTIARRKGESHEACKNGDQPRRATEGSSRKPKLVVPSLWLFLIRPG